MLVDHYGSGDHAGNAQGVSDQGQCGENPATCYRLLGTLLGWVSHVVAKLLAWRCDR